MKVMSATTQPLTVEQFDRLDLPQDRNWELHEGEVVEMPFPQFIHRLVQMQFVSLLGPLFPNALVILECPCQIGDRDKRSADVAVLSRERGDLARVEGILMGAPELVIEVLSPSNTVLDLRRYQRLCLSNGALLFVVVDPENQSIDVANQGGKLVTYTMEDSLPLELLGVSTSVPIAKIFEGIKV